MPKPTARTQSTHAPSDPAAALIAKAKEGSPVQIRIPPEAVEALQKLAAHNDTLPRNAGAGRVSAGAAIAMLREHFGVHMASTSRPSFDALCRRVLGRQSWGTP